MALHSLYCADVPLRNCSLTHSLTAAFSYQLTTYIVICWILILIWWHAKPFYAVH